MAKKQKISLVIFLIFDAALLGLAFFLIAKPAPDFSKFLLFNPKGIIASEERRLIFTALGFMLIAVIPAFVLAIYIPWKYRAGKNAEYDPNPKNHQLMTAAIWALPACVILILASLVWSSTHRLDPHKALISANKPIIVQVVALRWKWLFIYPEYNIATVNFLEIPEQTPITFKLTSDNAAMNSFWIPQLGGQMYAMTGMVNQTHLMASGLGEYQGSTAEMSGSGFAGMRFKTDSVTQADFDAWVLAVKKSGKILDTQEYDSLVVPSENNPPASYASVTGNLYNTIVMKYMPAATSSDDSMMMQMDGMK